MGVDAVLELTIDKIEDLFTGFTESNKEASGDSKKPLSGNDAIKYLMKTK